MRILPQHLRRPRKFKFDAFTDPVSGRDNLNEAARQSMLDSRKQAMPQVEARMAAGWTFEVPACGTEPWQWYWRRPSRRPGKPGRKFVSTNQAFNAVQREHK